MIGTNIIILYSLDNDKAWQSYLKKNSQAKNRTEFLLFVFPSAIYVNSRINKPVNTLVIWQINTLLCLYYSLSFSENMAAYLGMKATFLIERISNCHYHHCTDESSVKPLVLPESAVILNVENNAKMILIFQSLCKFSHCKQRIVQLCIAKLIQLTFGVLQMSRLCQSAFIYLRIVSQVLMTILSIVTACSFIG